jgi:hypothetical protein
VIRRLQRRKDGAETKRPDDASERKMKLGDRLKSPTVLGLQGFVAGAFLFFTVHPLAPSQQPSAAPSGAMEIIVPA